MKSASVACACAMQVLLHEANIMTFRTCLNTWPTYVKTTCIALLVGTTNAETQQWLITHQTGEHVTPAAEYLTELQHLQTVKLQIA